MSKRNRQRATVRFRRPALGSDAEARSGLAVVDAMEMALATFEKVFKWPFDLEQDVDVQPIMGHATDPDLQQASIGVAPGTLVVHVSVPPQLLTSARPAPAAVFDLALDVVERAIDVLGVSPPKLIAPEPVPDELLDTADTPTPTDLLDNLLTNDRDILVVKPADTTSHGKEARISAANVELHRLIAPDRRNDIRSGPAIHAWGLSWQIRNDPLDAGQGKRGARQQLTRWIKRDM